MGETDTLKRLSGFKLVVHVLGLGFEERCLSYPKALAGHGIDFKSNVFICIDPGNRGVSWLLRERREENRKSLLELLPAIRFLDADDLGEIGAMTKDAEVVVMDVSTFSRRQIIRLVELYAGRSLGSAKTFVIYSYPESYEHGPLQVPFPGVDLVFDQPILKRKQRVRALVLPGFEPSFTTVALTHIWAASGLEPEVEFLFGFPGQRLAFYQRAVESHLALIGKEEYELFPQDDIQLTFRVILERLGNMNGGLTCVVPLGPRVTMVGVHLAVLKARTLGLEVNIAIPKTGQYSVLRSEGGGRPLVEELAFRV